LLSITHLVRIFLNKGFTIKVNSVTLIISYLELDFMSHFFRFLDFLMLMIKFSFPG